MAEDESFRDIQLRGKQLVFLFMATTVVAVVIFVCGVMVGRGVKTSTAGQTLTQPQPDLTGDLVSPAQGGVTAEVPAGMSADNVPPPVEVGPESAPAPGPARGVKQPPTEKWETAPMTSAQPVGTATSTPAVGTALAEPPGDGYVVQVAALSQRSPAEAIGKQLLAKGYHAFVVPPSGSTSLFCVRIGKFKERREAEAVLRRLEKEEQFKPWITR
jgi:cell division septation protein DedD